MLGLPDLWTQRPRTRREQKNGRAHHDEQDQPNGEHQPADAGHSQREQQANQHKRCAGNDNDNSSSWSVRGHGRSGIASRSIILPFGADRHSGGVGRWSGGAEDSVERRPDEDAALSVAGRDSRVTAFDPRSTPPRANRSQSVPM